MGTAILLSANWHVNFGMIFDDTMTMKDHVTTKVRSCHSELRTIGKLRKYLSFEAADTFTHAFVTSRLDNGHLFLMVFLILRFRDCNDCKIQQLEFLLIHENLQIPVFLKYLHWLSVTNWIKFKILTLTYNCLHNLAPTYLSNMI